MLAGWVKALINLSGTVNSKFNAVLLHCKRHRHINAGLKILHSLSLTHKKNPYNNKYCGSTKCAFLLYCRWRSRHAVRETMHHPKRLEEQTHLLASIHSAERPLKPYQLQQRCSANPALWPQTDKANKNKTFLTGCKLLLGGWSGQCTAVKRVDWLLYRKTQSKVKYSARTKTFLASGGRIISVCTFKLV